MSLGAAPHSQAPTLNGALPRDVRFALETLEVTSRLSPVHRVRYPIDPMARFLSEGKVLEPTEQLRTVASILEWAYGYRPVVGADPAKARRRAASAGALYPIEAMVLDQDADGSDRLHYFSFRQHRFVQVGRGVPGRVREQLGAGSAPIVLLVAVLWRAAHRYGARAYLYSLLDAGHVATHVAHAARAMGLVVNTRLRAPAAEHDGLLALYPGESALLALELGAPTDGAPAAVAPPRPSASVEAAVSAGSLAWPPPLSPVLHRIVGYRRSAESRPPVLFGGSQDDSDAFFSAVERRRSAATFDERPFAWDEAVALIAHAARVRARMASPALPALALTVLTLNVAGVPAGARDVRADGTLGRWRRTDRDRKELRRQFVAACQRQVPAIDVGLAIVVSADRSALASGGAPSFEGAALSAGAVSADLYLESARMDVSTTELGGFDSRAVADLIGARRRWPLAVQVFGTAAHDGALKLDAAALGSG